MAEIVLPVVITAIANSELEGFVASTLYSQGWSVVYRALDLESLENFLHSNAELAQGALLLYSSDLSQISEESVNAITQLVKQVVGFSSDQSPTLQLPGLFKPPVDTTELLGLIRGLLRAPMIRNLPAPNSRRAQIISIGAGASGSGCTTIAINLAMELSALGRKVLLLDADVKHPSIAVLLGLHKLDSGDDWQLIASNLSAGEITQERVSRMEIFFSKATAEFDFIILDLGIIENIGDSLTDRRWSASVIHWSCDHADELWIVGRADVLGAYRFEKILREFSLVAIRAKVSVLLNMKAPGRKSTSSEDSFLAAIALVAAKKIMTLPRDVRAVARAQEQRATLIEIDERSALRKAIFSIAGEVGS
ncbi:MAG: P-loop NTPase [Actinobacteria bacterium]|nr:P-loop NTPase [Actinomycetota bacterium]